MSTGPLSTPVERSDGKFDLFHQGSSFVEAGLWSIGIPQKPSWCNNICIQVWSDVERAEILLRSVGGFIGITSSLVSLSTYQSSKHTLRANRSESRKDFWFPMFIYMAYPNTTKQKCPLVPFSMLVERTDGKFDIFHRGSGFSEAGL